MPYIRKDEKAMIEDWMDEFGLNDFSVSTPGQLNYVLTRIIHNQINKQTFSYSLINEMIGVLECAKLELYRMVAAPYEDIKRKENGNISELDS